MIVTQQEPATKKNKRSKIILVSVLTLAAFLLVGYFLGMAYIASKAEETIRKAMADAGVEAHFSVQNEGLNIWTIHNGEFIHASGVFKLNEAVLSMRLLSLAARPVKMDISQLSFHPEREHSGILLIPEAQITGTVGNTGTLEVTIPDILHIDTMTPYFFPFQLSAKARYDLTESHFEAEYRIKETEGRWQASGSATGNWEQDIWDGSMNLQPIKFIPGELQPYAFSPMLVMPPVTADVEKLTLDFAKTGTDSEWQAELYALLKDVQLPAGDARLAIHETEYIVQPPKLTAYPGSSKMKNITLNFPIETKEEKVNIQNITLTAAKETPATLKITATGITHQSEGRPWFRPAKAHSTVTYELEEQMAEAIFSLQDTAGQWTVNGKGNYRWGKNSGWKVKANLQPITFETGILQPDELFPVLRGKMQQTWGTISAEGEMASSAGKAPPTGSGQLTLKGLSTTVEGTAIRNINGNIAFATLNPPSTAGEQTLQIGEIVLGLPLSEGKLPFTLIKNKTLKIGTTSWRWAGGTLKTDPMTINLAEMDVGKMRLNAEAILLESLLANLLEQGISATGTLSGSIPVTFHKGNPMISGGVLKAEQGGVVRYAPQEGTALQKGSSSQTDILLNAMGNFHYEYLTLKVDSVDEDTLNVQLSTKGRNPDLYGGKPIELNVNLTGNLWDIARSGSETLAIPKRIEEQLAQ